MSAPSGVNAFISPYYSTSRKSYHIAINTQLQQYSLCKREIEKVHDDRDNTLSVIKGKQKKGLQVKRSGLNLTQGICGCRSGQCRTGQGEVRGTFIKLQREYGGRKKTGNKHDKKE